MVLRMLLAAVLSLTLAAAASYYYFSEPHRLAYITAELLRSIVGAEVHIDRAAVTFGGEIDLQGVHMRVPGVEGPAGELFSAERTTLKISPLAALRGKLIAREMVFIRPVLSLTQVREGTFNYELLRRIERDSSEIPRLPQVTIRQGQLRYGDVHEGEYEFFSLDVLGSLTPDPQKRSRYFFELHQYADGAPGQADAAKPAAGPTLRGSFDLERLEVTAKVSDFALIDPHRTALPRQIRQRWEMFEPSGTLPNARVEYDPKTGVRVELKLEGVAITIPQVSTPEYRVRMTDVSGTFRFDADKVSISDLVGQIEGIHYRINGSIDGYTPDAPFNLAMETRPFRIPEKPRYMLAMPLPVQNIFHMLTPTGWMRVSLATQRTAPGAEIDYRGTAKIITGRSGRTEIISSAPPHERAALARSLDPDSPDLVSRGAYFKFPYLLSNVRGLITFNNKEIEVKNLTGDTPGGGTATITGIIGPPSPDPAVDIVVTAVNIAFDDRLRDALGHRQQQAWDLFFDKPANLNLRRDGVYVSRAERVEDEQQHTELMMLRKEAEKKNPAGLTAIDEQIAAVSARLKKPVFELGGRGNALVRVKQAAGPHQPIDLHVTIDLAATDVLFRFFPYPVTVRSGKLIIAEHDVAFESIIAHGLHGGTLGLSGNVHVPDEGKGEITPEVIVAADNVPIDELLYSTIPSPQDKWLRNLNLAGSFDAAGNIYRGAGGIDFAIKIKPVSVTMNPGGGRFKVDRVEADLELSLNGLKARRFVGRHGEGVIEASGEADWTTRDNPAVKMTAKTTGLKFEDPVVDLLAPAVHAPQELRDFWNTYQPQGGFTAELEYERALQSEPRFRLAIAPAALSFVHHGKRVGLTETTGRFIVDHDRIELEDFSGKYDGGRLKATGDIQIDPHLRAELALDLAGTHIGPSARDAMPRFVAEALEQMKFSGKYHIVVPRLVVNPGAKTGEWVNLEAKMDLEDAAAELGLPLTEFTGWIKLKAEGDASTEHVRYTADVNAKHLRVSGRRVEDFAMIVRSTDDGRNLLAPAMRGRYYGGAVDGKAAVGLDDGSFNLQLAFSEVDLRQMVSDRGPSAAPVVATGNAQSLSGLMSLSLALDGSWKDRKLLRGRGDMMVRDAELDGVPLAMGLLRMAHLQLPGSNRFTRAAVSYYVRDEQVVFERIELDGPAMRIGGNGSMQYSTGGLDLTLTTSNPAGLKLGAVTTLIDGLRNQLVTIRVRGTADNPRIQVRQFNGITEAWRDVFGEKPNQ